MAIKDYIKSTRPLNITIVLYIIIGVAFALDFNLLLIDYKKLLFVLISFQIFYSGIYVINDIIDYKIDRLNPKKQHRPIASGKISRKNAFIFSCILFLIGLIIGFYTSLILVFFEILFLVYNIIYSFILKKIPYLDTISGALTHILRFVMGIVLFNNFNENTITFKYYCITTALFFGIIALLLQKRLKEIEYNEKVNHPIKYYSKKGIITFWIVEIFIFLVLFLLSKQIEKIFIGIIIFFYIFLLIGYFKNKTIKKLFENLTN